MKNTFRSISYTVFHLMIILALADKLANERYMALGIALISLIIFVICRPTLDEWKNSCRRRKFFYFLGAALFLSIGYFGKMKAVDTWQNVDNFVLYFKACGCLLFIKWIISCLLRSKYKFETKLINDYQQSFIGKLN